MSVGIKYTRELVADAVALCTSLSEVITRFGGRPTNGSSAYLRTLVARWGVDCSHFEREGVRNTEQRLGRIGGQGHNLGMRLVASGIGSPGARSV